MHKDAKGHFAGSKAHRCHGCTAKAQAEDAAAKDKNHRRGAYFGAVPSDGLWHAMSDPVLTYEPDETRVVVGASGTLYPPSAPPPEQ